MYQIKLPNGDTLRTNQVAFSEGFEHNFPSRDCGDISITSTDGADYHLTGRDCIPWDRMDTIIDFINEAAGEHALDVDIPDVAKQYIYKINSEGRRIRTQSELAQINYALDRLHGELRHILVNFDWSDFPLVISQEFELIVTHESATDGGVIAKEEC